MSNDERDPVEVLAHRIAWRYKMSSDPHHSDTYTFNRATLLQFAAELGQARAAIAQQSNTLAAQIMNIIADGATLDWANTREAYLYGHRDARHAAAELVDAAIAQPAEPATVKDSLTPGQADAQPVVWAWKHTANGGEGLYWQHPSTYGIDMANPMYEWTPLYAAAHTQRQPLSAERIAELVLQTVYQGDARTPYREEWVAVIGAPLVRAVERLHGIGEGEKP